MNAFLLQVYLLEVTAQCEAVEIAAATVDMQVGSAKPNVSVVWTALQTFAIAAGDLSRLFWGQGKAAERVDLRAACEVTDASPLYNRDFRNHLEHLDERLEEWLRTSSTRRFLDRSMGTGPPPKAFAGGDIFRYFDTARSVLIFRGNEYDLKAIYAEATRIHPIARQAFYKVVSG